MPRFAKLNINKRFPVLKSKSATSRRRPTRPRGYRRLFAEPLEWRLLLTTVTSVNPPENSHSAPVSTDISATFDQNINAATATAQNFVVHGMNTGQLGAAATSVSAAGATVTSNPNNDFFPGEIVQVSVTAGIQSSGGQAATPRMWQVRAGAFGGDGNFTDTGQIVSMVISV